MAALVLRLLVGLGPMSSSDGIQKWVRTEAVVATTLRVGACNYGTGRNCLGVGRTIEFLAFLAAVNSFRVRGSFSHDKLFTVLRPVKLKIRLDLCSLSLLVFSLLFFVAFSVQTSSFRPHVGAKPHAGHCTGYIRKRDDPVCYEESHGCLLNAEDGLRDRRHKMPTGIGPRRFPDVK